MPIQCIAFTETAGGFDWGVVAAVWVPILVAALALAFTVIESRRSRRERREVLQLTQEHFRISVRPQLVFELEVNPTVLQIHNAGLGPARVTKTELGLDGEVLGSLDPDSWGRVFERLGAQPIWGLDWVQFAALDGGEVFAPGEKLNVVRVSRDLDELNQIMYSMLARIDVVFTYESLADDEGQTESWTKSIRPRSPEEYQEQMEAARLALKRAEQGPTSSGQVP